MLEDITKFVVPTVAVLQVEEALETRKRQLTYGIREYKNSGIPGGIAGRKLRLSANRYRLANGGCLDKQRMLFR